MTGKMDKSRQGVKGRFPESRSFFSSGLCLRMALTTALLLLVQLVPARAAETGRGRLPEQLVFSGHSGPGKSHVLLVDKASQRLLVYRQRAGYFEQVAGFPCSTGKVRGPKQRSGDLKTPEGIYFFVKKHRKQDLAPIYGNLAFPMDYPNQIDRQAGRSGYAIWLHGTNKALKPRDSNGCVAVENTTIDYLAGLIRLFRTPMIISGRLQYRQPSSVRPVADQIRVFLSRWQELLTKGSYAQYLGLYAGGRGPGMGWWSRWCTLRKIPGDGRRSVDIAVADLAIYKAGGLFCVTFDQVLIYKGRRISAGRKKMFLARDGQALRIVAESYLGPPCQNGSAGDMLFAAMEGISNG